MKKNKDEKVSKEVVKAIMKWFEYREEMKERDNKKDIVKENVK